MSQKSQNETLTKKVCTSWSKSSQEKIEISHVWAIERFKFRKEEALYSATFSSPREPNYGKKQWRIKLCPGNGDKEESKGSKEGNKGSKEESKGSISIYLTLVDPSEKELEVTLGSFSLLDENGKCLEKQNAASLRTIHAFSKTSSEWGIPDFCKRDEILPSLTNFVLKVKCEFSYFSLEKDDSGSGDSAPLKEEQGESSHYNLSNNMAALLTGHQFSDVTLCVIGDEGEGTREFKAHKNILSVRSPYFAAMLSHNFKEKAENRVEIKEIKPEVFKEILSYIYTGKTSKNVTENVAKELLVAADRFALDVLKAKVIGLLVEKVNVQNALGLLVLGHMHSIRNLKIKATEFVAENANKVMKTEDWELMIREHPQLMEPILTAMSKKIEWKETRRRYNSD